MRSIVIGRGPLAQDDFIVPPLRHPVPRATSTNPPVSANLTEKSICGCGDPESQRKRTVQNVLDLRQNLEDTMTSLRGSQLSHSCLETSVCYDSDETNARSVSSMSNRSSPLSWRYGQSSPRLQAGDAPSSTGGGYRGGLGAGQYASHTMPARVPGRLGQVSRVELIEGLDADDPELKSGYLSDSDLLSKSLPDDDEDDDDLANG
ncbi:hypothetical protein SKAU_G00104180 [Synaphobranchus kaupii]|uniref:Neuron navigator 1 n=1 Tax=Synaphobranchus kaupii TaxID=118154 RepID=A0A9Q1G014_SYNKA|nr:hypothetical protein SKAU_G00104180 [Synaphobranchus kaupii]